MFNQESTHPRQLARPSSAIGPIGLRRAASVPMPLELSSEATARLEWLDDVIFAAIAGDPRAIDMAAEAWRNVLAELGAEALEESRLQYLRHAQGVWNELRQKPHQSPHHVFAAIEVISLLVGKAH